MTAIQDPLWLDGWEQEADAKAGTHRRPRRWARSVPVDYSRPIGRREIPYRPVVNVCRSL